MTQLSERHPRLVRKDQELQKLFEEADRRRKLLLQKVEKVNNENGTDNNKYNVKYILKPLRSCENLEKHDQRDDQIKLPRKISLKNNKFQTSYLSCQNLPETNLDDLSIPRSNACQVDSICQINKNAIDDIVTKSYENVSKSGHHNPNFVNSSISSSEEIVESNYCQFIPATSSNNTTNSSRYSGPDSSFSKSSEEPKSDALADFKSESNQQSQRRPSVLYYPSGSPLISPKYQGSPVVRIDNKIRAGEAEYLLDYTQAPLGKPPLIPCRKRLPVKPVSALVTAEKHHSQPVLTEHQEQHEQGSSNKPVRSTALLPNQSDFSQTIIRRKKKKMLEDHMRKRFSMGDYSTRSLIEWENRLNIRDLQQFSVSGDVHSQQKPFSRQFSSQSEALCNVPMISNELQQLSSSHQNYSSEINILHYSSTESLRDTQVSFSLNNRDATHETIHVTTSNKLYKRSGFLQRSLNDILVTLRNVAVSEKTPISRRFPPFRSQRNFRKRASNASDFLYSVPPFARKYLPPDISGAAKIGCQESYQIGNLPSSTPNLIAEIDPTFTVQNAVNVPQTKQPIHKRNRSYRLSFIEDAHTVTTKKLTETNPSPSPHNATSALRFVQPRRRAAMMRPDNSKLESHKFRSKNSRSQSSNRISCAQQ